MAYEVPHWINGKKVEGVGKKLGLFNPAQGIVSGHVAVADATVVEKAVQAAQTAFVTWSATTPLQRANILFHFKTLLDQDKDHLAALITREHGKTLNDALASIQRGIDVVDFACGIPDQLTGQYAANVGTGVDCYSLHQPLGVCVGITPFNFPAMIPLWMFPLAIACGNTFVLKPSEKDPSCSLRLAELAQVAGVPDGVINVVQGDKETVDALITHSQVKAVSFVGSSSVAEYVYRTGTAHHKRVQAFGGAKNHCIVMPDADLDKAADALTIAAYNCTGERCMAISVVVAVGDVVAEALIARIQARIKKINIGPGDATDTEMGPLVTQQHWQHVQEYIQMGKAEGATLVIDGSQYKPPGHANGFFMGCSLFDNVKPNMRIYREEIFGPVLCIVRSPHFNNALQLINDHEYGNGTAIFTRDGYIARTFADKVQVGMVGINVPVPVPVAYQSFGGWKRSVFADIGMYGHDAMRFYTRMKSVTQHWIHNNEGGK